MVGALDDNLERSELQPLMQLTEGSDFSINGEHVGDWVFKQVKGIIVKYNCSYYVQRKN